MHLVFVTEARFIINGRGLIFGDSSFNQNLWKKYLNVFNQIFVVARVLNDENYNGDLRYISSMHNVNFIALPYYIGLNQFLSKRRQTKQKIKQLVNEFREDRFICRVPGNIGNLVISELNKINKSYSIEVVGDPWDVFAPGAVRHPLRPFLRWINYLNLKQIVSKSSAVLYVTKNTLQKRYPPGLNSFVTSASNVRIEDTYIAKMPKIWTNRQKYTVISVGSLAQMYKSPDIVLKAIKYLKKEGIHCELIWLGDGRYKSDMIELSEKLGIDNQVQFVGNVSSPEVRHFLENSDLFVLASKTEGLPRAVIEAMAVGLPCIGSNVGGIPELLDPEALFTSGSVKELAVKIHQILTDHIFYNNQAQKNLEESRNYLENILDERRNEFYNQLMRLE